MSDSCLFEYKLMITTEDGDPIITSGQQIDLFSTVIGFNFEKSVVLGSNRTFFRGNISTSLGAGTFSVKINGNTQTGTFSYQCDLLPDPIVNSNSNIGNWRYSGGRYYTFLKLNLKKRIPMMILSFNSPFLCDYSPFGYDIVTLECFVGSSIVNNYTQVPSKLQVGMYGTIFNITSFIKTSSNEANITGYGPAIYIKGYFSNFYFTMTFQDWPNNYLFVKFDNYFEIDYKSHVLGNENDKELMFYDTISDNFVGGNFGYKVNIVNSNLIIENLIEKNVFINTSEINQPMFFNNNTNISQETIPNLIEVPIDIEGFYPFYLSQYFRDVQVISMIEFPSSYINESRDGISTFNFIIYTMGWIGTLELKDKASQSLFYHTSASSSLADNLAPELAGVEFIPLKGPTMIVRVHATDDQSGIYKICIINDLSNSENCLFQLNSWDLVSGDLKIGIFEKYLDYSDLLLEGHPISYTISDNAGNTEQFSDSINPALNLIQFPSTYPILPNFKFDYLQNYFKISYAKFTFDQVDLSYDGFYNTIYLNFNNAIPGTKAKVILGIDDDKVVIAKWNDEFQMFVGSFYLEARAFSGLVRYTVLYCGITYDSAFLPESSQLRVHSDNADRAPTTIKYIYINSPFNPSNRSGGVIEWEFEFSDQLNGLKYYIVHIISSLNPYQPLIFQDVIDGVVNFGKFTVSIQIPADCLAQTYTISYVELVDNSNVKGIYNNLTLIYELGKTSTRLYNPIFTISTLSLSIPVDCLRVPDENLPPDLNSVTFSKELVDTGSPNRDISISFTVDNFSVSLDPLTCVLYGVNFNSISTQSSYNDTRVNFQCDFTLPYGFGYPGSKIYLGIYGIKDLSFNYKGFTPNTIKLMGFDYSFDIEFNNNQLPSIDQVLPFSQDDNTVTVIGHSFGTNITETFIMATYFNISFIHQVIFINNLIAVFKPEVNKVITSITIFSDEDWKSNTFIIDIPTPIPPPLTCPGTPQPCTSTSNGKCTKSGCQCIGDWSGIDCSSKVIIINPPVINTTSPTIDTEIPLPNGEEITLKSLISVQSLNEIDHDGTLVKSHLFNQWLFKNLTSTLNNDLGYQEFIYSTTIDYNSVNTSINVNVKYFTKSQTILFANEQLDMKPSTFKYSIDISRYGFTNSLNSLQLIMSATFQTSLEDSCTNSESGASDDGLDGSNEYFKLRINSQSLYARFVKRGIIDNRVQTISNTLMNSTESTQTSSSVTNLISINIPHYLRSCQLDPDFSVLIDNRPVDKDTPNSICGNISDDQDSKSKLSGSQLAGIIVSCIVFLAAIAAGAIYVKYKKGQKKKSLAKMQQKLDLFK